MALAVPACQRAPPKEAVGGAAPAPRAWRPHSPRRQVRRRRPAAPLPLPPSEAVAPPARRARCGRAAAGGAPHRTSAAAAAVGRGRSPTAALVWACSAPTECPSGAALDATPSTPAAINNVPTLCTGGHRPALLRQCTLATYAICRKPSRPAPANPQALPPSAAACSPQPTRPPSYPSPPGSPPSPPPPPRASLLV